MLSMPTLWIVFVVNLSAVGLLWTYVARSYPNFEAARFWMAGSLLAALGAALSMSRGLFHNPLLSLIISGTMLTVAICVCAMGINRFYGRPSAWRIHATIIAISATGLTIFTFGYDSVPFRIVIYSLGQIIPIAMTLPLLLDRQAPIRPGARLTAIIAVLMIGIYVIRSGAAIVGIGGPIAVLTFNPFQATLVLILVFLSMSWNFGFLLMAIDRLRAEVGDLALLDDLTGVANRRHLLRRLAAECTLAQRTGDVFAILAIDLDGFKAINDRHGHAAGDECLRLFTRVAQSRLRPGDLLSRVGGDEFCIVLPATTQREGAMIARHILEACRAQAAPNTDTAIGVSIGVAQWHTAIGGDIERLIAAADQALYLAKSQGKNRFAMFDHAPRGLEPALRQTA